MRATNTGGVRGPPFTEMKQRHRYPAGAHRRGTRAEIRVSFSAARRLNQLEEQIGSARALRGSGALCVASMYDRAASATPRREARRQNQAAPAKRPRPPEQARATPKRLRGHPRRGSGTKASSRRDESAHDAPVILRAGARARLTLRRTPRGFGAGAPLRCAGTPSGSRFAQGSRCTATRW